MEIVSTNIGAAKTIVWQNKEVTTGIFKAPVEQALLLESSDVKEDVVVDRESHGGLDKAVYLFSADRYEYWKEKYPNLEWNYGMFGENLTVKNCNEEEIFIGSTYQVGTAIVQVAQPRQPCYKLGVRFKTQRILKQFINQPYSGIYFRVLKNGTVKVGDTFKLIKSVENGITVAQVFNLLYQKQKDDILLNKVLNDEFLAKDLKSEIQKSKNS
jgi:MOSC domain-containing protein YiiM